MVQKGPIKPVVQVHLTVKPESPPEMDVDEVTEQLSQQLYIDDIDILDRDNPQLVAEYVKEIFTYIMKLEVRMCI